jgi:hypothetical protein
LLAAATTFVCNTSRTVIGLLQLHILTQRQYLGAGEKAITYHQQIKRLITGTGSLGVIIGIADTELAGFL